MDTANKIEYKIRDLGTRSVTLFPTRAQVYREIKGVNLKPGTNEITIVGLSPTVDSDSIKVEGSGSAIITDIAVQSLPNRDIFEEIYPDSDASASDEEDDAYDHDGDQEDQETAELQAAREHLLELQDNLRIADEMINSSSQRISILASYAKSLNAKTCASIEARLEELKQEREKAFGDNIIGSRKRRAINTEIDATSKKVTRLEKLNKKAKASAESEKKKGEAAWAKKQAQKARRKEERTRERARIRLEREQFWPRYCYTVCITIEANNSTPMTSRRGSISSDVDFFEPESPSTIGATGKSTSLSCDMVLSYITSMASWSPSYDLQVATTNNTAKLCFDAQLTNSTSETWENCKVTLSTSETTVSGPQDAIPALEPWHIKLKPKNANQGESDIAQSRDERDKTYALKHQKWDTRIKSRRDMFGAVPGGIAPPSFFGGDAEATKDYQMRLMLLEQQNKKRLMMVRQDGATPPQQQPQLQQQSAMQQMRAQQMAMQQQHQQMQAQLMGQQMQMQQIQAPPMPAHPMAAQQSPAQPQQMPTMVLPQEPINSNYSLFGNDVLQDFDFDASLDFAESVVEETGLTTTYDIPGLKTLAPKFSSSKQRVARLSFSNVVFSHIVVAKHKPAAFIKVKIKNSSKLTLIKGPAGLTMDGSFIGKSVLPRCSAGDAFSLSLGVDPAIKVIYPKPDVQRASSGMFSKEDNSVYTRTITLQNTRASADKPVNLLVLDQVPLSQDERLRVDIQTPRGLSSTGDEIAAGVPARETGEDKDWGKATASLKKGGEVSWNVNLNAGKAVKLQLSYTVSVPSGEMATQ